MCKRMVSSKKKPAVFLCDPGSVCQPMSVFGQISHATVPSIEGALETLYVKAQKSQKVLIEFATAIANKYGEGVVIDPGVKNHETALDKILHRIPKFKGNVRTVTIDIYRASIVLPTLEDVYNVVKYIQSNSTLYHFGIVKTEDFFAKPKRGGYRDVSILISDQANDGLIGELRVQLCRIKMFSDMVGHHMYEVVRSIYEKANTEKRRTTNDENRVIEAIEESSRHGYDMVMSSQQYTSCVRDLKAEGLKSKKISTATPPANTNRPPTKKASTRTSIKISH